MEFQQLQYFLTVCKHMHITKAAQELYITQPALSAAMARLEKELGVPLFQRKGRNIILSEEGKIVRHFAQNVLNEYNLMADSLAARHEEDTQTIRLGNSSHRSLIPFLEEFFADNPQVQIYQQSLSYDQLKEKLLKRELDFCISSPPIEGPGISCETLCSEELFLQVPLGHPLARQSQVRLADCAKEKFMGFPKGYSFRNICDSLCAQAGFVPHYVLELDTSSLLEMRQNPIAHQYFGIFPQSLCGNKYSAQGQLVFLPISQPKAFRVLALSWLWSRKLNGTILDLMDYLKDYYRSKYFV